jgi:NAD-dependent dihydropyrimidine dehydrogenase PreA subunit
MFNQKEYDKNRYQQIKEKTWIPLKNRTPKWTHEYSNQYHSNYTKRTRKKILAILGNSCILCGFCEEDKQRLHFHEIYGKEHKHNHGLYVLKNIKDFVPLCRKCHNFIHIFCRSNGDIEKLVTLINWIKRSERDENKKLPNGTFTKRT